MDRAFNLLCDKEQAKRGRAAMRVLGRVISFKNSCGGILDATFEELCERVIVSQSLETNTKY